MPLKIGIWALISVSLFYSVCKYALLCLPSSVTRLRVTGANLQIEFAAHEPQSVSLVQGNVWHDQLVLLNLASKRPRAPWQAYPKTFFVPVTQWNTSWPAAGKGLTYCQMNDLRRLRVLLINHFFDKQPHGI